MPCRSDYMEPTARERESRRCVKNLLWLTKKVGDPIPEGLKAATEDIYGTWMFHDPIIELCAYIRKIGEDKLEEIVAKNLRSIRATDTMRFWNEHKAADRKREKRERAEIRRQAKARVAAERKVIMDDFKDRVADLSNSELQTLVDGVRSK